MKGEIPPGPSQENAAVNIPLNSVSESLCVCTPLCSQHWALSLAFMSQWVLCQGCCLWSALLSELP